jgi:hypothetical protein
MELVTAPDAEEADTEVSAARIDSYCCIVMMMFLILTLVMLHAHGRAQGALSGKAVDLGVVRTVIYLLTYLHILLLCYVCNCSTSILDFGYFSWELSAFGS